jgi:hypothetical protein
MYRFVLALYLAAFGLAGCDTVDSHTAREAQAKLPGMQRSAFYACAGLPNRSQTMEGAEYDTYDYQPYTPDQSISATLPLIGGIGIGSSGNCHATAIFRNGVLQEIDYAGSTGGMLGHVAECAPIVSHCLDGAKEATGKFETAPAKTR